MRPGVAASLLSFCALLVASSAHRARAEGVGQVLTSKSIPPATVALIDPESGTSAGGSTTDVNVAVGDVILFQFNFAGVPDLRPAGLEGYLTEYIPANTQVVGVRLIDKNGLTIAPRLPGIAEDSCQTSCPASQFDNLPCSAGTGCGVPVASQVDLTNGSIAQVYADTGVFYSTDSRTARTPSNVFITLQNGIDMTALGKEPTYVGSISNLIGLANGEHYRGHAFWDYVQMLAYGWKNSAISGNSGKNNTPFLYGSPVAGPQTYYKYEATHTTLVDSTTSVRFDDVVGPWQRIRYPGAKIGTGSAVVDTNGPLTRMGVDTTMANWGLDLRPNEAVIDTANALRYALGEVRVGEVRAAEVALRVLDTPLDPMFGASGADVDCAEVLGADVSGATVGGRAENNPWPLDLPSPSCVHLNLLFDLNVSKPVSDGSDVLLYTLRVKNLSTLPQTSVQIIARYTGSEFGFVSASNGGALLAMCPAGAGGSGTSCIGWTTPNLAPGDEYTYTFNLSVGGQGSGANVVFANYISTALPAPGFTTQALTIVKPVAVLEARMGPNSPTATAGTTVGFTGVFSNSGNQHATMQTLTLILPAGWTLSGTPALSEGSLGSCSGTSTVTCTFSGTSVDPQPQCSDGVDNADAEDLLADTLDPGCASPLDDDEGAGTTTVTQPQVTLTFDVNVPVGTPAGSYAVEMETWHTQTGIGGDVETYFSRIVGVSPACSDGLDNDGDTLFDYPNDLGCTSALDDDETATLSYVPELGVIAVGTPRSARPTLNCPIGDNATTISGNLDATTPLNATVKLYFSGIERASGVTSTLAFSVGGFAVLPACMDGINNDGDGLIDFPADPQCASPWDDDEGPAITVDPSFGVLYGGLEVRATATGAGELESPLSEPCFVSVVPDCSDGIDNDGDGLIDFPADPGCGLASDGSETDPQCSDGLDNDMDGLIDWPADFECAGPDDATELGPIACGDTLDNDGDGLIDFPADPGCSSAADRSEIQFGVCQDGVDNDSDLLVDFPDDPGCHSANDDDESDLTEGDIKSRLLMVFDTSGSMNWNTCNDTFTGGDGSLDCPGSAVSCITCGGADCGDAEANDSRLFKAKDGVSNVVAGFGEVEYGLMRFKQRPLNFACPGANASLGSGGWQGAGAEPCSGGFNAGETLVQFSSENQYDLLEYMDGRTNYSGTAPPPGLDFELRGSGTTPLGGALTSALSELEGTKASDPVSDCRPYIVILLTDGEETCGGDAVAAAGDLQAANYDVHVIGFATDNPALNDIADAGGTGAAIFVDDSATLSAAIAQIVADSILTEVCDGQDNDCDLAIDEGFTLYCNPADTPPRTPTLCVEPAETQCDGLDDDCDGDSDEGLLNACGQCPGGVETCNTLDDDCDGKIDEAGGVPGQICNCFAEICNNQDDDCDGDIDEDVTRGCGTDVGECVAGIETCTLGSFGPCVGSMGGSAETCDGQDDDCDGATDEGLTRSCPGGTDTGACQAGVQSCVAAAWEENPPGTPVCVGRIDPLPSELCNGVDDNCNGMTDEGNPQGGAICGTSVGECEVGSLVCTGGALVCTGGIQPTAESCNGKDDDCDGAIDDGNPGGLAQCGIDTGECSFGTTLCVFGTPAAGGTPVNYVCQNAVGPVGESCNGKDDDCDGATDETFPGKGTACGSDVGECTKGTLACQGGITVCAGEVGPVAETCNGLDDDCDGAPDDGIASPGPCGTDVGECEFGNYACVGGNPLVCQGGVTPVVESCDGLDNDCDGTPDDGDPQGGGACGTDVGACVAGVVHCVLIGPSKVLDCVGDVVPVPETCDGIDNDCDGVVDNGNPGGDQPCGSDAGDCQSGTTLCIFGTPAVGTTPENYVCQGEIPPLTERCDNRDNDCDGFVDNGNPEGGGVCGSSLGECEEGTLACVGGSLQCSGQQDPVPEACDDLDNDCDGLVDDGNPGGGAACGTGTGACQPGTLLCVFGTPASSGAPVNYVCQGEVPPASEICDGVDNDCDNSTDEPPLPGVGAVCGSNVGECEPGTYACLSGGFVCQNSIGPLSELCNRLDDDCDGKIDEGNPEGGAVCGTSTGECQTGIRTCLNGGLVCSGEITAVPEICDGLDNNCDGVVDEGNPGGGGACGTDVGQCTLGVLQCVAGPPGQASLDCVGDVVPVPEACDGLDNDCDGAVDDGNPGGGNACGIDTGACQSGTTLCIFGTPAAGGTPANYVCQGEISPTPEVCNGIDDDCDGPQDEGDPGGGAMCGSDVGDCTAGVLRCVSGGLDCVGDFGGSAEVCDGRDNDCNGIVDDGIPLGAVCGTDVGECSTGRDTCIGGTFQCAGNVGAVPELCNGKDDDCDGTVDDNNPQGGGDCGSNVGECMFGVVTCQAASLVCFGGVLSVPEVCDGLDNDCDGVVDNGDPGSGGVCGTDVGECQTGIDACVLGEIVCQGEITPEPERCDALDNNCNGSTDEGNPGGGVECGLSTGICAIGHTACIGGLLVCPDDIEPLPAELCNGADDDCDGKIDEGNPEGGGACGDVGPCRTGAGNTEACGTCEFGAEQCINAALACVGTVGPRPELCNGLDDDCDLVIDNGVEATDLDLGKACGSDIGECSTGTTTCVAGAILCDGGQGPVVEICDALDNDCDGVKDEGIPVGAPCGTDVGECQPGLNVCDVANGMLVCQGSVEPVDEICDALDNDCDGDVDEELALGTACGSDEGTCKKGTEECMGGQVLCIGEIPPGPEFCDCEDNDCDGAIDEVASGGDLCPGTSECIDCKCAVLCTDGGEFGQMCPTGKTPVDEDGKCFCVGQKCDPLACPDQTIERDGSVLCEPNSTDVGACACKQNECTFPCDGVVCEDGTVCDPSNGTCQKRNCALPQFRCAADERCNPTTGACDPDPCATADCKATEACRDGQCVKSCAQVTCDQGDKCVDGDCVQDRCSGADCLAGFVCDPANGDCIEPNPCTDSGCGAGKVCDVASGCQPDPCLSLRCPGTETCAAGQCVPHCGAGLLECSDGCVDPASDHEHCGASGDCTGAGAGEPCAEDEVCNEGACATDCSGRLLNCEGACIDPATSQEHCGATGDCAGAAAGDACKTGDVCREGECVSMATTPTDRPDAGTGLVGKDAGGLSAVPSDPHTRVLATGAGGCGTCAVPGRREEGHARVPFALALAFFGLLVRRLARRARRSSRVARLARNGLFALVLLAVALLSGCKVAPFCLDCGDAGLLGNGPGGGNSNPILGGDGKADAGRPPVSVGETDGAVPAQDAGTDATIAEPGCLDRELCNDTDDDCDGKVDEDIFLDRDPKNCGACGVPCAPANALAVCSAGQCGMGDCDVGFLDLNADDEDGCEYRCLPTQDDDSVCDLRDNDCDGEVDEDVDLQGDAANCGSCGSLCRFAHAKEGSLCVEGKCAFDPDKCDEGFYDVNDQDEDGCEYKCTPATPADELCNGLDDDCDGSPDEGVAVTDPEVAQPCGIDTGDCVAGTTACIAGAVQCSGSVGPTTETCNGSDQDCDGSVTESDANIGLACDESRGTCESGLWACVSGNLVCQGSVGPEPELCDGLDNDCNGVTDNGNPESGAACGITDTGRCALGTTTCSGGMKLCVGEIGSVDETCNTMDDDCDGVVDDGNPGGGGACGKAAGECEVGTVLCQGGSLICDGGIGPAPETCDGKDQDCDGVIDNGNPPFGPGGGAVCGSAVGECGAPGGTAKGTMTCVSGSVVCVGAIAPTIETCNGKDDDCNGMIDDGNPGGGAACGSAVGECSQGTIQCTNGALDCEGETGAAAEACDTLDNDCDAKVDESTMAETIPGVGVACGTNAGECSEGSMQCVSGSIGCVGSVTGSVETCNAKDDDCDGLVDNGNPGGGAVCGIATGQCSQGLVQCVLVGPLAGTLDCVGDTTPGVESCDGLDNDCDSKFDEGNPGGGSACGIATGECAQGTEQCLGGTVACVGAVGSTPEVCNDKDDDCDGVTDDGDPGGGATCGNALGECAPQGVVHCIAGGVLDCVGDTPPAAAELCNALDDDCDGKFDEGNPGGGGTCGTDVGRCVAGTNLCAGDPDLADYICQGSVNPEAETCNNIDDDCDGITDESKPGEVIVGVGDPCGNTNVGVCTLGAFQCVSGALTCVGATGGSAETCNGIDDDCDGVADNGNPGGGGACGTSLGVCEQGTLVCVGNNTYACQGAIGGTTETCNGLDDDCDGVVDDGNPGGNVPCGTDAGECVAGTVQCTAGALVCTGGTGPATETCDNQDDDCDGFVDDGDPGSGGACGIATGECATGIEHCLGGAIDCVGDVGASPELCDGLDNDCNGVVDNGVGLGGTDNRVGQSCGSDVGECTTGTKTCSGGAIVCTGGTGAVSETCNSKDDDCDGAIDDGNPGGGAACGTNNGECEFGTLTCVAGSVVCQGGTTPAPAELCNNKDDDCDLGVDEGNPGGGSGCGTDVGECVAGTNACSGGAIVCMGAVGPPVAAESCNGKDDDCDGQFDELNPGGGANCGTDTGACSFGSVTCVGGSLQCQGGVGATVEQCDDLDHDCDGLLHENFTLTGGDINHCGSCTTVCDPANAVPRCSGPAGTCEILACDPGWADADGLYSTGCELECTVTGAEVCNGDDDDCDGVTDDNPSLPPASFCGIDTGECNAGTPTCTAGAVTCAGHVGPVAETCNAKDDDCDGTTDEDITFGVSVGQPCDTSDLPLGVGACLREGTRVCDGPSATKCSETVPGPPGNETCNDIDDDCDGATDETTDVVSDDGVGPDDIATVDIGGGVKIFKYEASRADATSTVGGDASGLACSTGNRVPWTNVTWPEARDACCALNPNGTCTDMGGWRMCDATTGWESACQSPSGTCTWSYTTACSTSGTTSAAQKCNGEEYDCDSMVDEDQDCLFATGSATFPGCGADWGGAGTVYDMSGNAKEWTNTQVDNGLFEIRGGAYNSIEAGRTCDFDFVVGDDVFAFQNTGFRCCYYPGPVTTCLTYTSTDVPKGIAGGASSGTLDSTIDVVEGGLITDVNLTTVGTTTDFQDLTFTLFSPTTSVVVVPDNSCGNTNPDNWSFTFDDDVAASSICSMLGPPVGNGGTYRPQSGSLTSFDAANSTGSWTLRITDSDGTGATPSLTSWSLQICVQQ